jgi:hypothetical protein
MMLYHTKNTCELFQEVYLVNSSCRVEPRPGTGGSVGGSSLQPPYPPQSSDLPPPPQEEEEGGQRKAIILQICIQFYAS